MKNRLFLILALIALLSTGCSLKKQLARADLRYENGEYYDAQLKYRGLQRKLTGRENRSLKAEVNYKMGICYWKLSNFQRAAKCFQTAVKYKCDERDALLYLAKSQLAMQKYKEAGQNFTLYLNIDPGNYEAEEGLRSIQERAELTRGRTRFRIEQFKHFNSRRGSDFCPMYSGREDDNTIMFTSNRIDAKGKKKKVKNNSITGVPENDIYTCHKNKSGKWETVEVVQGGVNTVEDEGVTTFSADGREMLFSRCQAKQEGGQIFRSQRSGAEWTEAQEVRLFDDTTITVGHPALSPDGEHLYFASDCDRGFGGKDIWMAEKVDGKWGIPENLGYEINTTGDELFPYLLDDTTLYFASNGHVGLGGLDLYVATRDTAGHWSVKNLLAPVNSSYDDFGITFNPTGTEGFFSSNRNQRKQTDKIYHFFYDPIVYAFEGTVVDEKGDPVSEAVIRLVGDNGDIVKQRARKDGTFTINLAIGNVRYAMMASHHGYLNASYRFSSPHTDVSQTFTNRFVLVSQFKAVKMDNIFYEFGRWSLTQESVTGLNSLIKILTDNPNVTVEISAHTDMVGSDKVNDDLSQRRAQSVVNYLISAGIDPERLTPKGYGKHKPVVVSEEQARQYRFLNAGDVLTPEFIEKLTPEQQELCNQINRRTEFKVLRTNYHLY